MTDQNLTKILTAKPMQRRLRHIIRYSRTRKTARQKLTSSLNTIYIRDFFADNKGKSLEDAIKYRKYKKKLQGHNRYEKSDLSVLDNN